MALTDLSTGWKACRTLHVEQATQVSEGDLEDLQGVRGTVGGGGPLAATGRQRRH